MSPSSAFRLQHLVSHLVLGLRAPGATVANMVNGGVFPRMNVLAIVTISLSCRSFPDNWLACRMCQLVLTFSITHAFLWRSDYQHVYSMVSCNQTLAIMLTNDLCENGRPSRPALDIENSYPCPLVRGPSQTSRHSLQLAPSMSLLVSKFPLFAAFGLGNFSVAPSPSSKD